MKTFWIDIETRSRCDLIKHGVYRYAADPSTEILIICYALDDGAIRTWHRGQALPRMLDERAGEAAAGVRLAAHNAGFERNVLGAPVPGGARSAALVLHRTQARAAALAGSLESRQPHARHRRSQGPPRRRVDPPAVGAAGRRQLQREIAKLMAEFARYCAQRRGGDARADARACRR